MVRLSSSVGLKYRSQQGDAIPRQNDARPIHSGGRFFRGTLQPTGPRLSALPPGGGVGCAVPPYRPGWLGCEVRYRPTALKGQEKSLDLREPLLQIQNQVFVVLHTD